MSGLSLCDLCLCYSIFGSQFSNKYLLTYLQQLVIILWIRAQWSNSPHLLVLLILGVSKNGSNTTDTDWLSSTPTSPQPASWQCDSHHCWQHDSYHMPHYWQCHTADSVTVITCHTADTVTLLTLSHCWHCHTADRQSSHVTLLTLSHCWHCHTADSHHMSHCWQCDSHHMSHCWQCDTADNVTVITSHCSNAFTANFTVQSIYDLC